MIEINIPDLTSDELVKKIEQEIKRAELNPAQTSSPRPTSKSYMQTNLQVNYIYGFAKKIGKFLQRKGLDKLVKYIQKTFKLYPQNRVHVMSDFTKYYDEEFIKNAYNLIFYREPDEHGKNHYLSLLRSGKLSKTEVVASLYFSKEGREQNIVILGIKKRYILTMLYKIPILGYIVKTLYTVATLPKLIARINSHENLFYTQLQTKSSNESVSNLAKHLEAELKSSNETVSNLAKHLESELKSSNEILAKKADINQLELYMQTVNYAKEYMRLTEQTMHNLINEAKKRLPHEVLNQEELKLITEEEKYKFDNFYIEFEDKFRGSRDQIKNRVKAYLPYIEKLPFKKDDVRSLDVGCGRGEWLELLAQNGYMNAKGVDLNRMMVTKSKEFGLDVEEADVIKYLSNQKDESLSFITGFHIIEHLPFEILMKFLEESYRVLQKGGMVIFETPNPENIVVGACNFYTDPTHLNPIPPITGEFLLQQNGFMDTDILRLNLSKEVKYIKDGSFSDVNDILFAFTKEQDYAIIGYKK
jgi:2-polyprenyl-3-methyl-5-hydroxy-6-metoxy-1,4-benzoquinol methylase